MELQDTSDEVRRQGWEDEVAWGCSLPGENKAPPAPEEKHRALSTTGPRHSINSFLFPSQTRMAASVWAEAGALRLERGARSGEKEFVPLSKPALPAPCSVWHRFLPPDLPVLPWGALLPGGREERRKRRKEEGFCSAQGQWPQRADLGSNPSSLSPSL